MRLGCAAYSYRDLLKSGDMSLEQFVTLCADLGFDGVELTAYYFPSTDREYLGRVKKQVFRSGLAVSGTAVGNNFCQADEGARAAQVAMVKEWVDHSVVLGSPCLRVFAGPVPEGATEDQARQWTVDCLKECADYGSRHGVLIALENHGGITSTAEKTLSLVLEADHDWLGVNLDCGNFREDPYEEIAQTAPAAITTHAKVSSQSPEGRIVVDYGRVVRILEDAGYRGYLTIEYEEPDNPVEGVPRFLKALQEAVGR